MTPTAAPLALDGVSKSFRQGGRDVTVLDDVSLHVDSGEVLLLRGASGSGKSSVVRVAGCLSTPDEGSVRIQGHDTRGRDLAALRRHHIGIVFQNANLLPDLSVADNLAVASTTPAAGRIGELLGQWGLTHLADRSATSLSGGEAQRVAFCRALMNRPEVLLLDEPTAGLDAVNSELVQDMIRFAKADGRAVLLVSHEPGMSRVADRELTIEGGRLV